VRDEADELFSSGRARAREGWGCCCRAALFTTGRIVVVTTGRVVVVPADSGTFVQNRGGVAGGKGENAIIGIDGADGR